MDSTSIRSLLDQYHIPYMTEGHEHCRPGWLQIDCPFCSPDSQHWRLGINLFGHYGHCWACGAHSLIDTLVEATGEKVGEIIKQTKELDRGHKIPGIKIRGKLVTPIGVKPMNRPHRDYLVGRLIRPKYAAEEWGVQGIGIAPRLSWRLFIPIYFDSKVVSWTTRSLSDEHQMRYISAKPSEEAISHKSLLYGEWLAPRNGIIIVEGPVDCWKIGAGAVATLGTGYSQAQILRMARYPRRIICFDSERSAQKRANQLLDALSVFPGETMKVELDAKDAGSAKPSEIMQLRKLLKQ